MGNITDILNNCSPTWFEFVNETVRLGIEAASESYSKPKDQHKREGSIAGFEACRDKDIAGLAELLKEAREKVRQSFRDNDDTERYWYLNCYQAEVEWTCNVMSNLLRMAGAPEKQMIVPPTYRGMRTAARVVANVLGEKTT